MDDGNSANGNFLDYNYSYELEQWLESISIPPFEDEIIRSQNSLIQSSKLINSEPGLPRSSKVEKHESVESPLTLHFSRRQSKDVPRYDQSTSSRSPSLHTGVKGGENDELKGERKSDQFFDETKESRRNKITEILMYRVTGIQAFYLRKTTTVSFDLSPSGRFNDMYRAIFVLDWTRLWTSLVHYDRTYYIGKNNEINYTQDAFAMEMPFLYACYRFFLCSKMLVISMSFLLASAITCLVTYCFYPSAGNLVIFYGSITLIFIILWGTSLIRGNVRKYRRKHLVFGEKVVIADPQRKLKKFVVPDDYYPLAFLDNLTLKSANKGRLSHAETNGMEDDDADDDEDDDVATETCRPAKDYWASQKSSSFKEKEDDFWGFLRFIIEYFFHYCKATFLLKFTPSAINKKKKSGELEVTSFYQLVSVATRYLRSMPCGEFHFTPRRYTNLMIIILFPTIIITITCFWITELKNFDECLRTGTLGSDDDHRFCQWLVVLGFSSLGFIFPAVALFLGLAQLIVILAIFLYGTDVANALTIYWLQRFRPLRRIAYDPNIPGLAELKGWIERDSHERYLFIHSYFEKCSNIWSNCCAVGLLICLALIVYGYFLVVFTYFNSNHISSAGVTIAAIAILIFAFIILAVTYANSAIDKIKKGFEISGVDDYQLMGGRSVWIEYVTNSPIYWYILGFPISKAVLSGFIFGALSSVVLPLIASAFVSHFS